MVTNGRRQAQELHRFPRDDIAYTATLPLNIAV